MAKTSITIYDTTNNTVEITIESDPPILENSNNMTISQNISLSFLAYLKHKGIKIS